MVEISPPKRSSESANQRFRYFWTMSRSMPPCGARVPVRVLLHQLARALHDALDARLADEHVVRLFGEHEAGGARERIEAALGEGEELILAVAVGEHREHEEVEPVVDRLVEGAEDARLVRVAAAALRAAPPPPRGRRGRSSCGAGRPSPRGGGPPRRSPGRGCAGRRGSGAVWPSRRCCSTLAGSVSPWVTMRRRSVLRCSPGTSLPDRLAHDVAEADRAVRRRGRRGRCPSGSRASSRSRSAPSPRRRR